MIQIPCVIFAGGKSSRMQKDKALLEFGGYSSMTEFQYNRLKPYFKNIYISTKKDKEFMFDADFIFDNPSDIFAPTIGIKTFFENTDYDVFMAISVDTPLITINSIKKLYDSYQQNQISIIYSNSKLHPLLAVYPRVIYKDIVKEIKNNNHKLSTIITNTNYNKVIIDNADELVNLNYYHEYLNIRERSGL